MIAIEIMIRIHRTLLENYCFAEILFPSPHSSYLPGKDDSPRLIIKFSSLLWPQSCHLLVLTEVIRAHLR
jgi:hypothetical protein